MSVPFYYLDETKNVFFPIVILYDAFLQEGIIFKDQALNKTSTVVNSKDRKLSAMTLHKVLPQEKEKKYIIAKLGLNYLTYWRTLYKSIRRDKFVFLYPFVF